MEINDFKFEAEIWLWPGKAAWYFVTLPQELSDNIDSQFDGQKRGWGSLPVRVRIGSLSWKTSIFPDKKAASYVLPIKSQIRKGAGITEHSRISLSIEILV